MPNKRLWLVEMKNMTDRRDDEVIKVRAETSSEALKIAQSYTENRFYVGQVVPEIGGSKLEKDLAKKFRSYCSNDIYESYD